MNFLWRKWSMNYRNRRDAALNERLKEKDTRELYYEIILAFEQWQAAQKNFNEMTAKEEVDYAIFALEAAEKRYENLIRAAKNRNITLSKKNLNFF